MKIAEIKKEIEKRGGELVKVNATLNAHAVYKVQGLENVNPTCLLTKNDIEFRVLDNF